jgi:pimeloyl-ACP methyl ester carboxylesterase
MDQLNLYSMKKSIILGLVGILWGISCKGQNDTDALKSKAPYTIVANDGNSYRGEMGRLSVLENRDNPTSKYIEIPFFRLQTKSYNPLPPIFVLAGGPGDNPSVMQQLEEIIPSLSLFADRSDVVILEQRGNGNSIPNLSCNAAFNLPLDAPLDKESFKSAYRNYIGECSRYWKERKRDLGGYNVVSMADDIEALRKVLAYKKIMLFGGSFGSHHGLTYIKKYPNRVDRASLDSPEGLQHTIKLPNEVDKVLVKLSDLVQGDPVLSKKIPSFINLVKETLDRLEKNPIKAVVVYPETGQKIEIVLGKLDLQLATAMALGRMQYREIPYQYLQMKSGDYSWLANMSIGLRRANGNIGSLMASLTDCASGVTSKRKQDVSEQAKNAILGDALNNVIFEVCDLLPLKDLNSELDLNFRSKVPLLVICGSQDAKTPIRNGMEIMNNFENSRLLVVKHGSHDLFREAFDMLSPVIRGFLSVQNPLEYELPQKMEAPLNLRVN